MRPAAGRITGGRRKIVHLNRTTAGVFAVLSALLGPVPALAQVTDTTAAITAATAAADSWLRLLDKEGPAASYDSASSRLRGAITQTKWESALQNARGPFEPFGERHLLKSQYATELPNAPPGQYVILQYETVVGGNRRVVETVVPSVDTDGQWRVGGYFIRPQ
jgi:hypothetical protein